MEPTESDVPCEKYQETADKNQLIEVHAQILLNQPGVNWELFYRETLGPEGLIRQLHPTLEEFTRFQGTEMCAWLHDQLTKLRRPTHGRAASGPREPIQVVTIRIPRSLHEALREEAFQYRTSLNKLCISKLLQFIDQSLVPREV